MPNRIQNSNGGKAVRRNTLLIIASVVLATATYLYYTTRVFGFEQIWLHQATEIVLENGESMKEPEEIRSYLEQFEINNERMCMVRMDYGYTEGHIIIGGKSYRLLVTTGDKFVGASIAVETRMKHIELFRKGNEGKARQPVAIPSH